MDKKRYTGFCPGILSGLFIALFLLPLYCSAETKGEDVIKKLEQAFAGVNTFKASFKQVADISVAGIEKREESSGVFYLKKPGNIKWVYEYPDVETLLLREESLFFYSEPDNQLLKRKVTSLKDSANYLALLLNPDDSILKHYTLKGVTEKNGMYEADLSPKGNEDTIKSLALYISMKDFLLVGLRFNDNLENSTDITFDNMEVNPVIADDVFTLQVPPGTDVVDVNNDN